MRGAFLWTRQQHFFTAPRSALGKSAGRRLLPLSDHLPKKTEGGVFPVQAVIPPEQDGTGKQRSSTILLDAAARNSRLLAGLHGKYIIKGCEKQLHCIASPCDTEQYRFRYGLLCRDPEYGIEGSEMPWHQGQLTAGRGTLPGERFRSFLSPPHVTSGEETRGKGVSGFWREWVQERFLNP